MKETLLNQLRDRQISTSDFRSLTARLSQLIASEISTQITDQRIILVPILRAGLALLPSFLSLFEGAPVGFIGIKRDEKTALPHLYYQNLPKILPTDHILLLDPMLATGGSANLALDLLQPHRTITIISFIASTEGLAAIRKRHPYVHIRTVATDPHLSPQKFIVPGLGDFGDRYFGTTD